MFGLSVAASMFEPEPASAMVNQSEWVSSLVVGQFATTLCFIAVGFLGFAILAGRIDVRSSMRVVLGCSLLIGAPVIASVFWRR